MDDVRSFLDASEAFFKALAAVGWGALGLAVGFHVLRLALRVRGWQNILRAAYPGARVPYVQTFGAYVAGVGVNAVVPARGGDAVKLYLVKHRAVKESSYPTLTSSLVVEHPTLAAFLGSVLVAGGLLLAAWASRHVTAFREKLVRGFAILGDRRRYVREVVSWQAASWVARIASTFFFLKAFHVDATVETTLAVLVVQGLSTVLPFTPGGAGTQQAILGFALAGAASTSTILAFSFGQQLVITILNVALGFGAILLMLGTLRWRRHVQAVKEERDGDEGATGEPAGARSRSALPG